MSVTSDLPRDRRPTGVTPSPCLTNSLWNKSAGRIANVGTEPHIPQKSIAELFLAQALLQRDKEFACIRPEPRDDWQVVTWEDAVRQVACFAYALREELGVQKGDRVAIFSNTRYEWAIADLAILAIGAVAVSVYHSLTAEEAGYIFWDSDAAVVIAENQEQLRKIEQVAGQPFEAPSTERFPGGPVSHPIKSTITFETSKLQRAESLRHIQWRELIVSALPTFDEAVDLIQEYSSSIQETDLACLVYTSGTTAAPKGVMQTHRNHLEMLRSVMRSGLLLDGKRLFLYLPLAHSFAKLCMYAAIAPGGSMIFPTVVDRTRSQFQPLQVMKDIADSEPQIFPSVPRIFEKIMEGLGSPQGLAQKLAAWAMTTLVKFQSSDPATVRTLDHIKIALAQRLAEKVRKKIFGSHLAYCISGGAPMNLDTLQFFDAMGVMICEGYGLTETTPAMSANIPRWRRNGTVGRLFDCNEVRIAESDGEIEVRGGNVASGYWKLPQATAESWDADGWFKTGDIGQIDEDGFLSITDRKKDLIVSAGGKKVPPTYLEGKLKLSPYISQCLVYGDRRPYLVALITINPENVQRRLGSSASCLSLSQLADRAEVFTLIEGEISRTNRSLASFEQVKRFTILPVDFTIDNGLLTPSMKLKRKVATERYRSEIDALYQTRATGQSE